MSWLPDDFAQATLLGRMDFGDGPLPVVVSRGRLLDVSAIAPTTADYLNTIAPRAAITGKDMGAFTPHSIEPAWQEGASTLLTPVDLQCLKAAGVTFARSALERVIEERARGDASRAEQIRTDLAQRIGADLQSIRPGSAAAVALKTALIDAGLWSQYLEVAIGPDAEIFTKAPVLAAVGWGQMIGIRADSKWNNTEPEIVVVSDGQGRPRGATLGNDMNLRDFEGRSALLLGKAKDNNASCAIGPFVRLFDDAYTMDDVRNAVVRLEIEGDDGFRLDERSDMRQISRDPLELIDQAYGPNHQYPDGFALFLGTLFAPIQDRVGPGLGFTHHVGDRVRISSHRLGALENRVTTCSEAPPWTFGIGALFRNLAARGLLRETRP
jgi:fumarylacetoacetate (FAA) hydrolase family protein